MSTEELPRDDDPTASFPAVAGHAPVAPLTTAVGGDRCANCHTLLASDQRYCVNCGERRGRARFASEAFTSTAQGEADPTPSAGGESRRPRVAAGTTLVAFVATLLVAVGLGVLIGHDSSNPTQRAAAVSTQPVNVTVNGGGTAGPAASAGSGVSSGSSAKSGAAAKRIKSKPVTTAAAAKVAKQGGAAAIKVLGGGSGKLAAPTVKQGGACSGGAGCTGNKFTGNFFGGG